MHSMSRLTAKAKFYYYSRCNRFTEALAAIGSMDPTHPSTITAYYKIGCYRSASRAITASVHGKSAVALYSSYAAAVNAEEGGELLCRYMHAERADVELRANAALSIAPFSPRAGLALLEKDPTINSALLAALLTANERSVEAAPLIDRLAQAQGNPDTLLLLANQRKNSTEKLAILNEYLSFYELAPLYLKGLSDRIGVNGVGTDFLDVFEGPLVSIVVPAYNTSEYILSSLTSLLRQSYRNIEVIVVDDASTDDTANVVSTLQQNDARLILVRQSENGGPYLARNVGLSVARGDFVTCHDSDDWAHPQKIARQVAPLLKDETLQFTLSNWIRMADDGNIFSRQVFPLLRLNPSSPLFRRASTIADLGYYQPVRTGADSEYIARLKLHYGRRAWQQVKQPLTIGAHRPGSLMTDSLTGHPATGELNPRRLEYWEKWNHGHIEALRRKDSLYVPFSAY